MDVSSVLLFDKAWWLIFAMPFVGILCSRFPKRVAPFVKDGKIYRHDKSARLEHWPHALGTLFLLISGFVLGLSFWHGFTSGESDSVFWLDVHYVAACAFLFGTFFYLANLICEPHRGKDHLPNKHFLSGIINHYGSKFHIKGLKYPEEGKYFQSENVAYLYALIVAALMAVTGIIKTSAHVWNLPADVMAATTFCHDVGAILMILFFVAHIFFAVLIPSSHKTAPSMITGWQPEEVAKEEHQAWYRAIKDNPVPPEFQGDGKND